MTNEDKGSPFSDEQKFIGFVWNGVAKTMRGQEGKRLMVGTDNTTTENSINNKKSRDVETNAEWSEIQKLLLSHHVDLVAKRVTSKDNKADALSRGLRSGQDVKHQVVIDMPNDLCTLIQQVVFCI
ncbi:hypothetical protein PSTG_11737 [Puccinia striiformis f. sp. tritici PST-78]|uniref:Uncharacterized protein n=1 Tax=Puccinia striiformis f. sp. tritici PST-78 TaxID=1165861 RepID=A0A0L0V6X7_9BASI|nr:hypothetical protein PSTG_11737 [Puccinia striiformis f. sp. tritici PST-78]